MRLRCTVDADVRGVTHGSGAPRGPLFARLAYLCSNAGSVDAERYRATHFFSGRPCPPTSMYRGTSVACAPRRCSVAPVCHLSACLSRSRACSLARLLAALLLAMLACSLPWPPVLSAPTCYPPLASCSLLDSPSLLAIYAELLLSNFPTRWLVFARSYARSLNLAEPSLATLVARRSRSGCQYCRYYLLTPAHTHYACNSLRSLLALAVPIVIHMMDTC